MPLDNHMSDEMIEEVVQAPLSTSSADRESAAAVISPQGNAIAGGTVIIGGGVSAITEPITFAAGGAQADGEGLDDTMQEPTSTAAIAAASQQVITPAPAVSAETAEAMEAATTSYVEHLNELNEMLEKVAAQSSRLATDSEEMENLNRTLTGISRVYEMQLKSASQQITTQDEINAQTRRMAQQIQELNAIYTRMIEAMTVNMNPLSAGKPAN